MALLYLDDIHFSVGTRVLLDGVNAAIEPGERVCLIGRNGEGKSTLLRIVTGEQRADAGDVRLSPGARLASLAQDPRLDYSGTVREYVSEGLGELGADLARYHALIEHLADADEAMMREFETLQQRIEARDGWRADQRVQAVMQRLGLPGERPVADLSGGWRRRAALGRALVSEPDILLLDEPTNHLDIEGIAWLQDFLRDFRGALLFITHDRAFLQALATRILELDRGQLSSWPGDYANYLRRKEEREHAESLANADFDKKLAIEEVWIRQGIEARRTRNEGRVRRLKALREERSARVDRQGRASMSLDAGQVSGKRVFEAEHVDLSLGGKALLRDFNLRVQRGDRIGLIGPNGAGKSTLLKLLLGEIAPDAGTVERGTQLSVAFFDQHRSALDPERTAIENLDGGNDMLEINGEKRHAISYLRDFLFTPDRARSKVSALSGGERNRLMLAKLFMQPANLLVLDEPTNDLDLEALEVLEEVVLGYTGTLLIVSHDREFIDNTVTSVLVFEGEGQVNEYVGGYSDWLRQRASAAPTASSVPKAASVTPPPAPAATPTAPRKLGFKEQRELDELPARIETLEQEQAELTALTASADFYQGRPEAVKITLERLNAVSESLGQAYARWEELEARRG
ncbi:MAG: ATP-binding cassette domain-containing protein [Halothiobacillaceae bacterium]|nr:ATP-binding cassette domain-containing protein [Halothiobacillaceae bacterium]